uniref:Anthocyanin-activating bHLH3 n=1 Tax=Erythranthe lewisii TaxID=69919 RepID=A0A076G263_ERYLE|nr:anthocyanin-activating bHLH3 [Erythranthe lewisii]
MVEPPKSRQLQSILQAAVQTVQWTYCVFWQLSPQQGTLVWREGYYNGAIKTRKTVQPTEVTTEEATLQRSQQLRELYESLSATEGGGGGGGQQSQRPSVALSPEDLTEPEWFYLMCVSFSFPPGVGLPGKAYAKRQHIWLTEASEADSKTFSRSILAKTAGIQTVVCIPLLDGVVEVGTTERVEEDIGLIRGVKSFFNNNNGGGQNNPNPQRPALSEHSTSNPPTSSEQRFLSPPMVPTHRPTFFETSSQVPVEEDDEDEVAETGGVVVGSLSPPAENAVAAGGAAHSTGHHEPMQVDIVISENIIRVRTPDDDCSNDLDSNFHLLAVSQPGVSTEHCGGGLDHTPGSVHTWPLKDDIPMSSTPQPPSHSGFPSFDLLAQEDTHYSQTVSSILETQSNRWSKYSSTTTMSSAASTSAFSRWSSSSSRHPKNLLLDAAASQWALKYILFTVPLLHNKSSHDPTARGLEPHPPPDELSANHVLAERRRREKLNERFIVLRSLVPFVTKMDKASILGDTIDYVKQLRKRIQELESDTREKRKMRILEKDDGGSGGGEGRLVKVVESPPPRKVAEEVEVSIIESDALVEIRCVNREGLLLGVMQVLAESGIEVTTVQSSISNGIFAAELRAKVKENVNARKPSIVEVKRSIHQIILHY